MSDYNQDERILKFTSPLGTDVLLAERFSGTDEISELFDYAVDVLSDSDTVVLPASLVGKRVTVEMRVTDTGDKRFFNGIVRSLESTGGDSFFHSYRIRMAPALWLLSLNTQTRVFEDKTVLEIVRAILAPYSIAPSVLTQASYQTLEYCTQYRETDLHFLERILQQHGIFFYFTHGASDHVMVLADSVRVSQELAVVSTFRFGTRDTAPMSFYEARIHGFHVRSTLIPGEETSWDYRFRQYAVSHASPQTAHSEGPMGNNAHEHYDYSDAATAFMKTPGADAKVPLLQTLFQQVAKEGHEAQAVQCVGVSTANTMQSGYTFLLEEYPQTEMNTKYLLTRVTHRVQQRPSYRAHVEEDSGTPYSNEFEARPFEQAYRKAKTLAKPRVSGVVTAKVVTLAGQDSHMDEYGRVCVQFWWDRTRPPNTPDKTLLRVAQQWAGKGWGTYFWPRAGDEVLVDFVEGDPNAPIVVGSIYNGVNMPKYDPLTQYTRSGILTRSSKGGTSSNANELRLEDKAGAEQIFLNAERDMDQRVEHDSRRWVGGLDSLVVQADQRERVQGSRETTIGADQKIGIGGSLSITAAEHIVIEAGTKISFRVGETFITLGAEGVSLSGPLVRINSGGTPSTSLGSPRSPDIADDGTRGGKMS